MGGISYLVDVGLSNLLVYGLFGFPAVLHDSPLKAKIVSTVVSIIVAWVGNKFLTYKDRSSGSSARGFVMFVVVNLAGMLVVLAPLGVTWYVLGLRDPISYNVSTNVIGIALGMIFRFYAYRTWVFRDTPQKEVVVTDVVDDSAGRG